MRNKTWNYQLVQTPTVLFAAIVTAAVMMSGAPVAALETGVCRIEVLVDGHPLTEYAARGTTYIEALHGREYALRVTNLIDRRIAVALAVDGLNSIDAATTSAAKASKWVLGPYETTTISGWQISSTDARRFFFTTEEKSYGAWLDRAANLGVIEAVVFRERAPRPLVGKWQGARAGEAPAPAERKRRSAEGESDGAEKSAPFEELMNRLEEVVDALERGDMPLEKSLRLFEEGIALSRAAGGRLDAAERKIEELLADGSTVPLSEGADGAAGAAEANNDDF